MTLVWCGELDVSFCVQRRQKREREKEREREREREREKREREREKQRERRRRLINKRVFEKESMCVYVCVRTKDNVCFFYPLLCRRLILY